MKRLHIGLLMTYNEADVLPQMLTHTLPSVDAIFALDGSSDATPEILRACPKLEGLLFDRDVAGDGRVRDHHRQALLEAARAKYGAGHWYSLLHADEIAGEQKIQNLPAAVAERLEAECPTAQQRVQRRVGLAFVDQRFAGTQAPFAALQRLHELQLFTGGFVKQLQPGAFPILLAHHPHAFDVAAVHEIPLTFAGHTHGGQLMLSAKHGAGPVMFRYWSGLYQKLNASLIVSNGAGNWFPLRTHAPAEIIHLTLRRA